MQNARRTFLRWLAKITGGYIVFGLAPVAPLLTRINSTRLGDAQALTIPPEPCVCEANDGCLCEGSDGPTICPTDGVTDPCGADTCTRDMCESGDAGHTCHLSDSCDIDESGDCRGDNCTLDKSGACKADSCTSDNSGLCVNDSCAGDSSGDCTSDLCLSDSSDACTSDKCHSDSSGWCTADQCEADSSGDCVSDECMSDAYGACRADLCVVDRSRFCKNDQCASDTSGACKGDSCRSDSSGGCMADKCESDTSGACKGDSCLSDSSGGCMADKCESDSSGACISEQCTVDSSQACTSDLCYVADASGTCETDRCNSDASGDCTQADVCVLDASTNCENDLCREDRTPDGTECTTDTCALDLAMNEPLSRRKLAHASVSRAIKWLYRLSAVMLLVGPFLDQLQAATVIDARNAVFSPQASFVTGGTGTVPAPVGAFLRDCDSDNITEADTNGDGQCASDPEVRDYNGDGSRELPSGATFTGDFQYSCFHIPDDVALVASGALTVGASRELAVFGSVRLPSSGTFFAPMAIDLHTSAWLSEDATVPVFTTALSGEVSDSQTRYSVDGGVPSVHFTSDCNTGITIDPTSGLITTESGDTDQFSVVLDHRPSADVVLGFSSSNTAEGTVLPASLTFTATDWNMPQVVTVTGVDDGFADENKLYQIIAVVLSSTDPDFATNNPDDINVINVDPVNGCSGTQLVVTAADVPSSVQLYCVGTESIEVQSGVDINTGAHVELYAPVHSVPGTFRVEKGSTLLMRH